MKKLNFLLIMPRVVVNVGENYIFPLGITYISAVMKQANFNVFTLNLNHIEGEISEIIDNEIQKNKINVVMIGGVSQQYSILKNIIDFVRSKFPQIKIIIGGGIITADPEVAMTALECVDVGVIGEGETTAVELCNALQSEGNLSEIAGIIYMSNGNLVQTKAREEIMDLDSLPFPDWDGFELKKYLELSPVQVRGSHINRTFYVLGSRSCPGKCTFCFKVYKKCRQRSMGNIIKEIEVLVEKYNIAHITMFDELFLVNKENAKIMGRNAKKNKITWSTSSKVNFISQDMIKILKSGNCISLILGLESADDRILKSMGKSITIEQTEKALKLCYDSDIATHGNFIFGDIEETIESANKTLNWWEKHRHYNISLAFIIAYPGTHIYKYALQNGTIKDPVKFLKDGCPQINISKLSNDELSSISKRIISLNSKMGLRIDKMEKITLYSDGISFDGKCIKCGKIQHFNHVRLFSGSNSVICSKCGQKSQIELPKELEEVFLDNLQNYLDKKYKIGLWGIYRITINLFENNNVFKNDNVFFVDSAEAKQLIKIHDKKVYSPDELLVSEVDIVIFFYQKFYLATAEEVKLKYPKVKKFINVYDLLKKRG